MPLNQQKETWGLKFDTLGGSNGIYIHLPFTVIDVLNFGWRIFWRTLSNQGPVILATTFLRLFQHTELEHTPKRNLYQQAISRDSFHNWRTGDCRTGCAISGVCCNFLGTLACFGSRCDLDENQGSFETLKRPAFCVPMVRCPVENVSGFLLVKMEGRA